MTEIHVALLCVLFAPVNVVVVTRFTHDALVVVLAQGLNVFVIVAVLLALHTLDALLHGRPHVPPCEACGAGAFTVDSTFGIGVHTCRCGRRYVRRDLQCLEVLPGGATRRYRRWRPFRRWVDDRTAIDDPVPAPYRGSGPPP